VEDLTMEPDEQEQSAMQRFWRRNFPVKETSDVLVIGLGRFGSALATTLVSMGHDVLAVDSDAQRVQDHKDRITHVRQADCTSEEALRQVGAETVSTAVVCIGTDVESSVLSTAALVEIGVPKIWAKAITKPHAKILQLVGAHRVVLPESEMGERTAHLVTSSMIEYFALDQDFLLVELSVSKKLDGVRLGSSDLRAKFNITVVCIKHGEQPFTYTTADTMLHEGDLVVIAGHRQHVERFAESV
jgi:trk system potassium uptake protein